MLKAWTSAQVLARCRNYRRAAIELGVSQSHLSRTILSLEAELGFSLFERSRQGMAITPAGARALSEAAVFMKAHDAFMSKIGVIRSRSGETLNIGAGALVTQTWAPKALADLAQTHPEVSISMRELDWWRLADAVLSDEFHLVIGESSQAEHIPDIVVEHLPERRGGLFVRVGHPLAGLETISFDQIFPFPLASPRLPSRIGRLLPASTKLGQLSDDGRFFLPKFECATPPSMFDVVLASDAICMATTKLCAQHLAAGTMVQLPFEAPWISTKQAIMHVRGRPLTGPAQAFRTVAKVAERKYFAG